MNIQIICVGKLKENYLRDACDEYAKRLSRYCKFSIIELDECKVPENASDSQIESAIIAEGNKIISKINKNAMVFSMCIEGKQMSSEELAQKIETCAINGTNDIVFLIGGSWGLSKDAKALSDFKLSMSKMTFPHQLARVILCEQIYRCFNIINGGKYHK